MDKSIFPQVKRGIQDFLYEEEGNIPRNKMLTLGTMVLLMSILFASERPSQILCKPPKQGVK